MKNAEIRFKFAGLKHIYAVRGRSIRLFSFRANRDCLFCVLRGFRNILLYLIFILYNIFFR